MKEEEKIEWIYNNHVIRGKSVCCLNHCCEYHDFTIHQYLIKLVEIEIDEMMKQ